MEPGSLVVIQVHYNTTSATPVTEQQQYVLQNRAHSGPTALIVPYANPAWIMGAIPMAIPAGDSSVTHGMSYDVISANILSYFGEEIQRFRGTGNPQCGPAHARTRYARHFVYRAGRWES